MEPKIKTTDSRVVGVSNTFNVSSLNGEQAQVPDIPSGGLSLRNLMSPKGPTCNIADWRLNLYIWRVECGAQTGQSKAGTDI